MRSCVSARVDAKRDEHTRYPQMLGHVDVQTTQRYAHLENRDIGQKTRDIMESLNQV